MRPEVHPIDPRWPFFSLDLELTTECDRNCAFCCRHIKREHGEMSESTWNRILAEARTHGSRIAFSGMGDPLRHPHWQEWLAQAREARLTAGVVVPGGSLSVSVVEKLIQIRPSFVEVSCPTLRAPLYQQLQPRDDLPRVIEHIRSLRQTGGARFPLVVVGLLTRLNQDEEPAFQRFWNDLGIQARMFPCHSRGHHLLRTDLILAAPVDAGGCGLMARHSFIAWNGDALACCHDLDGSTSHGNVKQHSFLEIGSRRIERVAVATPFELCRGCDEIRRLWPLPAGDSFPNSASARSRAMRRLARTIARF